MYFQCKLIRAGQPLGLYHITTMVLSRTEPSLLDKNICEIVIVTISK